MSEPYWNKTVPELTVSNYQRSLEFYTAVLGFSVRFTRENFAYLELGEVQLMLEQYHPDNWNTAPLEYPFGRGINFQMDVDEVQPIVNRLLEVGHPLFRPLQETWYATSSTEESGQLEFLTQDLDGYLLRFCQFLGTRAISRSPQP